MEHFSALPKAYINSTAPSHQLHAVFHSFLSDNIKQYAATNNEKKQAFDFVAKRKESLTTSLITIWKTLMFVLNNIDVPLHFNFCQLFLSVTPL